MGEKQNGPFQLSFNASLKVDFQGSRVTSDDGLILVRELDARLGLGELITQHLSDSRRGKNTQLPLTDLFRQSLYSRIAGYEDVNDAERLAHDPTFRLIGFEKIWEPGAALTSRLQTFETEMLAEQENFAGLVRINRELIGKAEAVDSPQRVVLDMDSTEIPVYGQQENSAYDGHLLLSPAVVVQPRGRLPGGKTAVRQRPQCRRLGRTAPARDRAAAEAGQGSRVSRRRGLRQAGDLRGAGGARREGRYPHSGQRRPGAGHRRIADPSGGTPQPQAGGLVQELPVPGSESEDSASRGSQGGVSFWRVVPSRGVHRDQPGDGQPCSGAVLQQAGDGGAVDQGRQAGGQDDAAELPPVTVE